MSLLLQNRDPEHASSKDLINLPKHSESRLIIVKIDAKSETDAVNAIKYLQQQGLDHLDIVVANAGVAYRFGKVSEMNITDIRGHIEPNVYGVVRLYQAALPLLLKSKKPKWVTMGSVAGSIEVSHKVQPYDWCDLDTMPFRTETCQLTVI